MLRAAGVASDIRREEPYCGIEAYEFDVPTQDGADAFGRYLVRMEEMRQSVRLMKQALESPRPEISVYAPRMIVIKIKPEKIRDVIGKGGAVIRAITEETGTSVP